MTKVVNSVICRINISMAHYFIFSRRSGLIMYIGLFYSGLLVTVDFSYTYNKTFKEHVAISPL